MSRLHSVSIAAAVLASAVAAVGVAAPAGAHRDPCHTRHGCPPDHQAHAWRGRFEAASAVGVACGVERWSVKTLTDADARSINLTPRLSTVAALGALRPPGHLGPGRIGPVERTVFRVNARLVGVKAEMDSDLHLVIADPHTRATMIAEFPASFCVGRTAPLGPRAQMRAARAALLRCGLVSRERFTPLSGVVSITGVGFWDFPHGQRGVAPNAIELHPVLSISGGCT